MAVQEKILAVLRVKQMWIANPITNAEGVASASWVKLPCTLRDDEVPLKSDDPEEQEVFCNESDIPVHTETTGKPYYLTGSFVEISEDSMVSILGFEKTSLGLEFSGDLHKFEKAIKVETHSGKTYLLPRVDGQVRPEFNFGTGKVSKAPFKFTLKKASEEWQKAFVSLSQA